MQLEDAPSQQGFCLSVLSDPQSAPVCEASFGRVSGHEIGHSEVDTEVIDALAFRFRWRTSDDRQMSVPAERCFLLYWWGRGRMFQFRPTVSADVKDELSPAVTRSPGTKSHQSEAAPLTVSSQMRVYENARNPLHVNGQWLSFASERKQIE